MQARCRHQNNIPGSAWAYMQARLSIALLASNYEQGSGPSYLAYLAGPCYLKAVIMSGACQYRKWSWAAKK